MPPYLQGLGIGLAYVAPIGMQNLFVINSALTQPRRKAMLTALIVIFFDISLALACFFGIGALVTWCNPQALIDGTMLFGGFHAGNPGAVSTQLILGSSSASFLWFFGITVLISCFSAKFNDKILRVINIVCGVIIIFYGAKLLFQFFQMIL